MENAFEMLTEFQYSSEAYIYKGKLESEGIEVFMRDQFTVDANPMISNAVGGIKLYVKSEDYTKAKEILAAVSRYSIDNHGKALQCPKCGAEKIEMLTSIREKKALFSFIVSLLIGGYPYHTTYKYKCRDCNFEFSESEI